MRIALVLVGFTTLAASDLTLADLRSHCLDNERTVWSCRAKTKYYSVCASQDLGPGAGYLQYRAGRLQRREFAFPVTLQHPKGSFRFRLLAHGASLRFENGAYEYEIIEDIKGETSIFIQTPRRSTSVACAESTGTLTENTTIDLMQAAGIGE